MAEKHTSVPFRYAAILEKSQVVGDSKHHQDHSMSVGGKVHPEPYDVDTAWSLARGFLQPLVDLGWVIQSLDIRAYGS